MQTQNRFFDDMARVASGALSGFTGLRQEIEARVREQIERLLRDMDLVTREEFEAVKAVAATARAEQERLAARLAKLEGELREVAYRSVAPEGPGGSSRGGSSRGGSSHGDPARGEKPTDDLGEPT